MELAIRRASSADAEGIARVHVETWRSAYRGLVPEAVLADLDLVRLTAFWRDVIAGDSITLVTDGPDGVAAFAQVRRAPRDADSRTFEINALYVLPDHARRGLGTALMSECFLLLEERGCEVATLWVFAGNASAIAFYENLGFAADGATKLHALTGLTCLRMCRNLGHERPTLRP